MLSLILGTILGALIYYYLIKPTNFWAEKNITHVKSWPIFGSSWPVVAQKKHLYEVTEEIYQKFPDDRYVGYKHFTTPFLLLRDLELIKQIAVKEHDIFPDHQHNATIDVDPMLSNSLNNLHGDKWKQMRATLSPVFTSSKMKNMYQFMEECAKTLTKHFEKGEDDIELKNLMSRFANDIIATTAFGIQVDAVRDPKHEFYLMGQKLADFSFVLLLKLILFQASSTLVKIFNIRLLPKDATDFFVSIIKSNINKRIKEKIVRLDLIHLLLEAKKGKLKHEGSEEQSEGFATVEESHVGKQTSKLQITDDVIASQATFFFFAGFDTVSTASSLMAYELAINPDVQKKLQEEIDEVRKEYPEEIPYEVLLSMKYLDQVICESLRKWPPIIQTDRYGVRDFVIPPKTTKERTLVLEKGLSVIIPIMALHRDPQYFPEPKNFDPERFNDENKTKIVPGSYLPFGIGPRNCIGSRFALLEMKTLFVHLLSKFDLVPNAWTEIPLKMSPKKVTFFSEKGFHLGLKPRKI